MIPSLSFLSLVFVKLFCLNMAIFYSSLVHCLYVSFTLGTFSLFWFLLGVFLFEIQVLQSLQIAGLKTCVYPAQTGSRLIVLIGCTEFRLEEEAARIGYELQLDGIECLNQGVTKGMLCNCVFMNVCVCINACICVLEYILASAFSELVQK